MPFIRNICNYRSLAIVGLEKNTGKTVCLNYILRRLHEMGVSTAVTSIGVDGEQVDAVYATAKPEIVLYEGMRFITSQMHYQQRNLVSRIISVDERRTALGPLVTAEVMHRGKAILSGAATTKMLRQQIAQFQTSDIQLAIVDGALSRISLASPTVTDAMILATGAAVSPNLSQLVSKTKFAYRLIMLEEAAPALRQRLHPITSGTWGIDTDGEVHDLELKSTFLLGSNENDLFRYGNTLYTAGVVSDRLLKYLCSRPNVSECLLIAQDFTKLFITPETYANFTRRGGRIQVVQRSNLIAVTVNPTSPQGYLLNSAETCHALSDALGCPVYDLLA